VASANVLDIYGDNDTNNQGVDFYGANSGLNQEWLPIIAALGDHPIYFVTEQSHNVLDVRGNPGAGSTTTSFTDLDVYTQGQYTVANQQWRLAIQ
jgi:hypothetical protein